MADNTIQTAAAANESRTQDSPLLNDSAPAATTAESKPALDALPWQPRFIFRDPEPVDALPWQPRFIFRDPEPDSDSEIKMSRSQQVDKFWQAKTKLLKLIADATGRTHSIDTLSAWQTVFGSVFGLVFLTVLMVIIEDAKPNYSAWLVLIFAYWTMFIAMRSERYIYDQVKWVSAAFAQFKQEVDDLQSSERDGDTALAIFNRAYDKFTTALILGVPVSEAELVAIRAAVEEVRQPLAAIAAA